MRVIQKSGCIIAPKPQAPVPAAPTQRREAPQINRVRFTSMQDNDLQMTSQPEPEETSVEPPPNQSSKLPLNPAVLDRINSFGAISISRVNSSSPINRRTSVTDNVVPPPLPGANVDNILNRYKHLWSQE